MNSIFFFLVATSIAVIDSDIRKRKISNRLNILFFTCCFSMYLIHHSIELHLVRCLVVIAVGFIAFYLGIIGAGDIKLLAALSLVVDDNYWILTLIATGLLGGIAALVVFIKESLARKKGPSRGVPYAIPILVAGLTGIYLSAVS
ncbi:A24 family peptidase [Grimontia hollisae]|uniref:Flp pilus assembly protein, protease CpaA n=1 Tax=Grimontia hollisae TaxID=673 RepID=A0A377J7R6_GRIHO|nr:prepilin peptidase [Grimontia hollisae]STO77557.1 Flp pilus assembly protein, protease CpaA [Grimontia hollisae]STO98537.1 Flp pilus assembly protein, protease CpaA [Grimontia hollisae]STQ75636.1 Flp pilus assembly protein, protease CpaA [Grimontia hollisae]